MNPEFKPTGSFARRGRRALARRLILAVALSIDVACAIHHANFHAVSLRPLNSGHDYFLRRRAIPIFFTVRRQYAAFRKVS